jgi:hypothetical protein
LKRAKPVIDEVRAAVPGRCLVMPMRFASSVHDFGGPIALERPERLEKLVVFNTFAFPFTDAP